MTLRTMMMATLAVTVALGMAGCRNKLDGFRVDFIDGCKQSGGTTALCTCIRPHETALWRGWPAPYRSTADAVIPPQVSRSQKWNFLVT